MRSRACLAARELDLVADVSKPASSASCAMPEPIAPRPTTPTILHSFSTTPAIAIPNPTHIEAMP